MTTTIFQFFHVFGNPRRQHRLINGVRVFVLALLAVGLVLPAAAMHHVNTTTGLTLEGAPIANRGYDPVAYFTEDRAVPGKPNITAIFDGAVYHFSSEANKRTFAEDPSRYAPRYGGFCAFGVAVGAKFDGDPEVFRVVDGKLYLNVNRGYKKSGTRTSTAISGKPIRTGSAFAMPLLLS